MAQVTKKDFENLARVIQALDERYGIEVPLEAIKTEIAWWCAEENPRFDLQKFLKACEPQ